MTTLKEVQQATEDVRTLADAVDDHQQDLSADEHAELDAAVNRLAGFVTGVQATEAADLGKSTKRRDRKGRKLRVGDRVKVFDSARFGDTEGVVTGPGEQRRGSERVIVRLDGGQHDRYSCNVARAERIGSIKKELVAS